MLHDLVPVEYIGISRAQHRVVLRRERIQPAGKGEIAIAADQRLVGVDIGFRAVFQKSKEV
jgi:hypothetical protein